MKKIVLSCLFCLLLCAGCVEKVESTKKLGFGFQDQGFYPRLKGYNLSLELSPGTRRFRAGYPAELTFILQNRGKKEVKIPEWFKFDPNNLRVMCQVWLPGTDKPSPTMWLDLSAPVKRPIWRYPLTIPPGEKVFVSTNLDFISNLVVPAGSERRFFVRAALNLKSVDVTAPMAYISVLPGKIPPKPAPNKKK